MKYKRMMLVSMLAMAPAMASANPVENVKKDIEVMQGVFVTSLKKRLKDTNFSGEHIDVVYLRDQGVVYTVSNPYEGWRVHIPDFNFNFDFSGLPDIPSAPVPPEHIAHEIEMAVEREWEHSAELHQQHMESMQEVHQTKREIDDLKFEISQAVKEHQKTLKQQLKEAEERWQKMKVKLSDVELNLEKLKQKQIEVQAEREQKQAALIQSFVQSFEEESSYVLCRFGGGLRSLPDSENISFILKSMGEPVEGKRSDLIYSFSKADVQKCVSGKMKEEALIKSAQAYSY